MLFFVVIFFSCIDKRISSVNFSSLYDADYSCYLFAYSLFHKSDDTVELHIRIPLHEFLYKRDNVTSDFKSNFAIMYWFYDDSGKRQILDSAVHKFEDSLYYGKHHFEDYFIPLPFGKYKQGLLKLSVTDLNNKINSCSFLAFLNKKDTCNRQYFYIEHKDKRRVPSDIFNITDTFRIHVSELIATDTLFVAYFSHFTDIALPPFSYESLNPFEWKPDSAFYILCKSNRTEYFCLNKEGVYLFMSSQKTREGISVIITRTDYPNISKHEYMAAPIKYIASYKEFRNIETNPDFRTAVEDFWLSISSNYAVAQRLIKEYYNRVQYANKFFTSYKEGWMSDRGMIYIVMGKPNTVFKTFDSEIWIYGEHGNVHATTLEFKKVINPLSDNDYILTRNPTLKDRWYKAVNMWRR